MTVSLTVIVPTMGRPSLRTLLLDLAAELRDTDEVLVVGDGPQPRAAATVDDVCRSAAATIRYFETEPNHFWGTHQRNVAMPRARGTHLLAFDDDDRVITGAIGQICAALKRAPDRPHIFQLWYRFGLIWKERRIAEGNVGTQMIVAPNRQDRLGVWGNRYEGDYDFVRSTVDRYPDGDRAVVWCETPIAVHGYNGELAPHPPGSIRNG